MKGRGKMVLVTGGAGFIGSNLVHELVRRRRRVRVLDDFSTGRQENLRRVRGSIEVIRGDIRKPPVCRRAVKGAGIVYHLAALPSVSRSVADPVVSHEVNVTGTLNLLQASREAGVEAFVYSSSSSVYGDTPTLPKKEGMREQPLSPYAVSKLAAEKYCRVYYQLFGLRTVALRYFNVYGPRQDPKSQYAAVIPKFITRMLSGQRPEIYGDGLQTRDFTFVRDAVEANLLSAASRGAGGQAMNSGSGTRSSLISLAKLLNRLAGTRLSPILAETRPGDVRHSLAAVRLAKEVIGYRPRFSLEEGLRETIAHFTRGS